jgi:hypothetical protein
MALHHDFLDFLAVLDSESVEYLIVGGYAVGYHSRPRYTKDLDIFVSSSPDNRQRVVRALTAFGAPHDVVEGARVQASTDVVWMGHAPTRIDILTSIDGVEFNSAYARRIRTEWEGVAVYIIALDDLIHNKHAAGRAQDQLDVAVLEKTLERPPT